MRVLTSTGLTNSVTFTVTAPATPTLTSITPNSGVRGTSVPVTITGTNLTGAAGLNGLGGGVTVASGTFSVVNSTTITATLNISATATLATRNLSVTTPGGTSNAVAFTVQGATLASISPNSHTRGGAGFQVTLTGANLTGATNVTVSGTGVTVSNVTPVNSTTVTATFTISGTAGQTGRNVAVVTPIGMTGNVTFTVQ